MEYSYYYNNVPGVGLTRNNLIYTSLISDDQKTFVQWYNNDTKYHFGQNEIVDSDKMEEKWQREVKFLTVMSQHYKNYVPEILEINYSQRKIYLAIDGLDFWNRSACSEDNYDSTLIDWQDQMIDILKAHRQIGIHKYSMHPSSYFVVDGKLKSINYFFSYYDNEPLISVADVQSHIHSNRQQEIRKYLDSLHIKWNQPQPWSKMDQLCWNSFRNNYPEDFIQRAMNV